MTFHQRLREVRAAKEMSQDELADRSGIHSTAIGRLERGGREPRLTTILRLAHGLGVDPGVLVDDLDDTLPARRVADSCRRSPKYPPS